MPLGLGEGSFFAAAKGLGSTLTFSSRGAAATPIIKFGSDTNSGIFSVAANMVSFAVSGAELFRISTGSLVICFGQDFQIQPNTARLLMGASSDLILLREAADTLGIRRAANAQLVWIANTWTSVTNFERLSIGAVSNVFVITPEAGSGGGTLRGMRLGSTGTAIGFLGATPSTQQTGGENLTNSVASGGTDGTVANYTDLAVYLNDSTTIRNNIYQLARVVKQDHDALRLYGLLS